MPSEIAQQIVNQIFGDEKAKAVDSVNDALSAAAYDAVQARKLEFAQSMGFELDDTAQDAADEIAAELPDGTDEPEEVDVDGRRPEDPPAAEASAEEQPEETPEEENETDS